MSNSLVNFVNQALPTVANSNVTYCAEKNMFLTTGHTSGIGHTYFRGIQLSDRVAVVCSIGRGGWGSNPHFLNEVTVYCFDGKEKKIIGKWSPRDYAFYSDSLVKRVSIDLLYNYLKSQTMIQGAVISDSELKSFATVQIDAVANYVSKQLA